MESTSWKGGGVCRSLMLTNLCASHIQHTALSQNRQSKKLLLNHSNPVNYSTPSAFLLYVIPPECRSKRHPKVLLQIKSMTHDSPTSLPILDSASPPKRPVEQKSTNVSRACCTMKILPTLRKSIDMVGS
jgi:hypothetical protein